MGVNGKIFSGEEITKSKRVLDNIGSKDKFAKFYLPKLKNEKKWQQGMFCK